MALTWATAKSLFEEAIGDTTEAFFDDATQERLANNVLNKMSEAAEYRDVVQTGTLDPDQGNPELYALSGMFDVWRVEVDDKAMAKVTLGELRRYDVDWRSKTGLPWAYYTDESLSGANRLVGLFPSPSTALGYRFMGHGRPVQVDDDNPSYRVHVPQWAEYGVLFGMLEQAFAADTEIQNLETAAIYGAYLKDILFRLRARSFSKLNKTWGGSPQKKSMYRSFWDTLDDVDGT